MAPKQPMLDLEVRSPDLCTPSPTDWYYLKSKARSVLTRLNSCSMEQPRWSRPQLTTLEASIWYSWMSTAWARLLEVPQSKLILTSDLTLLVGHNLALISKLTIQMRTEKVRSAWEVATLWWAILRMILLLLKPLTAKAFCIQVTVVKSVLMAIWKLPVASKNLLSQREVRTLLQFQLKTVLKYSVHPVPTLWWSVRCSDSWVHWSLLKSTLT